jgi:hypothetical protein
MTSVLRRKYELGKYILMREGLLPFIKKAFSFPLRSLIDYKDLYIYELLLNEQVADVSTAEVGNLKFEMISTTKQLLELTACGFDFGIHIIGAEERLNRGALMFCVFVGNELAHMRWVATTAAARDSIVEIPCEVDFSNNEVYLGWSETDPKYRRKGLFLYNHAKIRKFMVERGISKGRILIKKSNIVSQQATVRLGGRIRAEGLYLRLLRWKFWKEKPIILRQAEIEENRA